MDMIWERTLDKQYSFVWNEHLKIMASKNIHVHELISWVRICLQAIAPPPSTTTIWRRYICQFPSSWQCVWVSVGKLDVSSTTTSRAGHPLLFSSNRRTCWRSLIPNVTENVKPFSFWSRQCSHFWLDTLVSCQNHIILQNKSAIIRQKWHI